MEIIAKISKGSKMDQVYIPKQRSSLKIGQYVIIKPLKDINKKREIKPIIYGIKNLEPIKISIIKEVFNIIDNIIKNDNIIITGSFLDKGFNFNDLDMLILAEKGEEEKIEEEIKSKLGINAHILNLSNKALSIGLQTDPLYRLMLNRCVSKNRIPPIKKPKINYKILDLHLINSKSLIENYNILKGEEKNKLTRNLVAIHLFLNKKKINSEEIKKTIFSKLNTSSKEIKQNQLNKKDFLKSYEKFYEETHEKILNGIKNESK